MDRDRQSLGVTKQAAQKRFVGPAAEAELPVRPPWMTEQAAAMVHQAHRVARALGCRYIDVDHLVLAALHDRSSRAYAAVRGLGAAPAEVNGAILAAIPPGPGSGPGTLPFTPRAKQALDPAGIRRQRDEQVGPEHVLMNVLASRKGCPAQRTLHEFGVTERGLRSWLASN